MAVLAYKRMIQFSACYILRVSNVGATSRWVCYKLIANIPVQPVVQKPPELEMFSSNWKLQQHKAPKDAISTDISKAREELRCKEENV